ncbi:hypothetical protein A3738_20365 [Oleiphilus sp. HI0066]|nr:hypothetical protein A3738_20365 [Oleiphilus sp. HI0066]
MAIKFVSRHRLNSRKRVSYMNKQKGLLLLVPIYLLVVVVLGFWWSSEPDVPDLALVVEQRAGVTLSDAPIGVATTASLIELSDTLLEKPGGYLSNDLFLPGVFLDNMPSWEFGVLVQIRDLSRVMRKDFSRSQSQSQEDASLKLAEPQFHFDNRSWILPASESEYRTGVAAVENYLKRLADESTPNAQFYARADNLSAWLSEVENRLGGLSRRLSESVGRPSLDLGLAGDYSAEQSTSGEGFKESKTSWFDIDNVFYEARGTAWALIVILRAMEHDFAKVLGDKNALISLRQIRLDLEATQNTIWSPMILNGSGFGVLANHSLTMSSYISRASAAVIDLRNLLQQG